MHHITEDTPPDMLAGAMDLAVHLPDGRDVNMAVERGTPMMDLLVQVTTAYKLRPSDYIIQPLDMSERERALPYKPNTPIGALDTQRIRVLPKGRPAAPRVPPPPGHQPFESTFRLQVHLPRNQFIVIRVGKFVMLEDIMKKVCEEKNLDPRKYEFRHPANIDKVLDPKRTLNDYEITEITVVARGVSSHMSQTISSSDIMALQREEERRKLQAKTGGGVLNLIFRRGRTSMGSGSVSSDTRSISPTQSDDSRSVTPPAVPPILPVPQEVPTHPVSRPKPPQRKRRPAPKPPSQALSEVPSPAEKCQQEPASKLENGLTICHSRNSSDSSGYHEASILSDHCTTLPRRPKATVINTSLTNSTLSVERMEMSTSTGNLTNMAVQSKSTMSLANAGRKKKAPPPPPALKSASSVANISTSIPVVASSNEPTPKVHSESACPATPSDLRSLPRTSDASINTTSLASFAQDSSNNQPSSRSSLTSSENPISELSSNSLPNFTSTPTRKENGVASQSFGESRIVSEPERKKSIIEIERKLTTIEPERKQSLPKVESERKTSLPKEVMKNDSERKSNFSKENVKEERKQSLIKDPERKQSLTKEVMKMVPDRKDSLSKETIEEKRKHSFIKELEGKQSLTKEITEPERKQSLPKEVMKMVPEIKDSFPNVEEERKQSLTREPERKQSLVKEEQLEDNLIQKKEIDIRKNLTDAQKLDPIKITNNEQDDLETDWQYTLPSPPKAFRDSSPTNFTDMTNYDTVTFNGLPTDSVVTDPTLFEKLEHIKDRSETETIVSEESTSSKPEVTKYLNLENLEKRKSLVLERELASLKNAQNKNTEETIRTQRDNLKNEIEEVIKNKTLSRSNSQSRDKILATDSTLPNFKITTYDQPKNKLNIYEDDTVRSNVENNSKRNSLDLDKQSDNDNFLRKKNTSTENMFFTKRNSVDDAIFKKPEMPKYKRQVSITNLNDVSRSESFSTKNSIWERSNPVKRSKSHISLDKYKDESKKVDNSEEGLHKSSSLFNVSGLQSLEVMRLILPKLGNTPPSTPSEDLKPEPLKLSQQKEKPFSPKNLTKTSTPKQQEEETKKYQYSGPPAINLGTWSERPKSQVSIKEDQDYKISKIDAIKNKFSQKEKNFSSVNIRVNEVDSGAKLNIKVNDSKTISHQSSGNVIIKIEPEKPENKPQKNNFYSRFLNQTTAVGYRKPLGNINGVDKPRPHSIAFDANCPDLSRVPIVRAVELKKPYKDTNKSVTQIVPENNLTKNNSSVYLSSENLNKPESNILSLFSKPITRGNSFASNRAIPTVKGFRMPSNETEIETKQYATLPNLKSEVQNVPFSQNTLRKTENSFSKPAPEKNIFENVVLRKTANNLPNKRHSMGPIIPPAPPQMPKIITATKKPSQRQISVEDPRDQLLESIRNFGGKNGLRAAK